MAMEYERRRSGGGGVGMGGGCFSCCFGFGGEAEAEGSAGEKAARALRRWVRKRAGEVPELVARVRRPRWRPRAAGEFGYDPVSYALNFEEERPFKHRSFSSRLPASPPPAAAAEANHRTSS